MLISGTSVPCPHSAPTYHVYTTPMAPNEEDSPPSGAATPRSSCDQGTHSSVKVRMVRAVRKCRRDSEPCSAWLLLFFVLIPLNIVAGIEHVSYSLYYVAYAQYFPDETRYSIGVTVAIRESFTCLFSIFTSVLIDRYGSPAVVAAAGFLMSCGLVLSSLAPNIYMLYITQGMLVGIAMSFLAMAVNSTLQWTFSTNRGFSSGLGFLGYTLGHIAGIPLIDNLVNNYGWRGCVLIQGGISANAIALSMLMPKVSNRETPHTNTHSDGTKDTGTVSNASSRGSSKCFRVSSFLREVFDFSLLKDTCLWLVCLGCMTYHFNEITYYQHMPSRAVSLGFTRSDGATFMSAGAMSALVTRVLVTFISNLQCVNRVLMYSFGYFIGSIGSFVIALCDNYNGQLAGAMIIGIYMGCTNTITYTVLVDLMGVVKLNKSMALLELANGISAIITAPLGGLIYDLSGSYDVTFLLGASINTCGGLLVLISGLVDIKRRKVQRLMEVQQMKHIITATSELSTD